MQQTAAALRNYSAAERKILPHSAAVGYESIAPRGRVRAHSRRRDHNLLILRIFEGNFADHSGQRVKDKVLSVKTGIFTDK